MRPLILYFFSWWSAVRRPPLYRYTHFPVSLILNALINFLIYLISIPESFLQFLNQ